MCVCPSPLFSAKKIVRGAILGSMVRYGPQMSTTDFDVNWYIFKVTWCKEGQEIDLIIVAPMNRATISFCFKNICGVFN